MSRDGSRRPGPPGDAPMRADAPPQTEPPPRRRAPRQLRLSLLLAAVWLLQQCLAPSALVGAALVGWAVPRLLAGLLPAAAPQPVAGDALRRTGLALRLVLVVLADIVVSNLVVARIVLNPWSRPQPAWVAVAHDLDQPLAITLLATIITTTPGTVSCVVDEARREILVHALDCADPQALALHLRSRYPQPLKEILG